MNQTFSKSIQDLLKAKFPHLLPFIQSCSSPSFSLVKTRWGMENLVDNTREKPLYYHSNYDPLKETHNWLSKHSYGEFDVLYIYGLGMAYAYEILEDFLKLDEHYVVFIEDEIQAITGFLSSSRALKLLSHPRLHLHYLPCDQGSHGQGQNSICVEKLSRQLVPAFFPLSFTCLALPAYHLNKQERFLALHKALVYQGAFVNYAGRELTDHGEVYFKNFYSNLNELSTFYKPSSLHNLFEGVPAIICGAGPSLDKQLPLLKKLGNKALILSGGSGVTALSNQGLVPHFGASVDPNVSQYHRMLRQSAFELPVFTGLRVHKQVLPLLRGCRFFVGNSAIYPITNWVQEYLGIGELTAYEEGYNVVHLLMDLARHMGCNPLVLVGMDLGFSGGLDYADGIGVAQAKSLPKGAFLKKSVYGEELYTLWKWVEEAAYIQEYSSRHPSVCILNATEGGLGIEGLAHPTLKEVFCDRASLDIKGYTHQILAQAKVYSCCKKAELFSELYESCRHFLSLLEPIKEDIKQLKSILKKRQISKIYTFINKIEDSFGNLEQDFVYAHYLKFMSRMKEKSFQRKEAQWRWDPSLNEGQKQAKIAVHYTERLEFYQRAIEKQLSFLQEFI